MNVVSRIARSISLGAALAACAASPPPPAVAPASPSPASSIDPISGLPREPAAQAFPPPKGEHLCNAKEEVVFACTLEGPAPQASMSLCLQKGSPRNDPAVVGRQRVDGQVEEPFAGQSSMLMITELLMGKVPFSVEMEQRAPGGSFGAEKVTEPNAPSKPPRYRRNLTLGKGDTAKLTHTPCDPAHPITDNFEAMRAYKL